MAYTESVNENGDITRTFDDGFQIVSHYPKDICTIICAGNDDLFHKLVETVRAEYGNMVQVDISKNDFGADLAKFIPVEIG